MKHEIPIHYTDEIIEEAITRDAWQKPESKPQETPPISHEKDEKVVSVIGDWKAYAIAILLIITIAFIAWWFARDTWMVDNIENIKWEKRNVITSQKTIDRETIKIAKSESNIESSKKVLKEKYSIIYQ